MNIDSVRASFIWHWTRIAPCFAPLPEAPLTNEPSLIAYLPREIARLIIQEVFARSRKSYSALMQTCTTIYGTWNSEFFRYQERLPLYKTLLASSGGDHLRVSAMFQRVLGNGMLVFPSEQELQIELKEAHDGAALEEICAHFPNCSRLSIVDARAEIRPRTLGELFAKWALAKAPCEPEEAAKKAAQAIASAINALPKLRELSLTYRCQRRLHVIEIARHLLFKQLGWGVATSVGKNQYLLTAHVTERQ